MADRALGLMSGTSADGVSAALLEVEGRRAKVAAHQNFPYPAGLRRKILEAASLDTAALSKLNFELGWFFAGAARRFLSGRPAPKVIGSHGQTLWHGPADKPSHTLQLGEPSMIAELCGIPVVADFRPRDMAAGGQGAPLTAAFDEFLYKRGPLRALQNIGGLGNVSAAGRGKLWKAFDTGPGNCLMDLAVRLATSGRFYMDKNGYWAARGRPDVKKVDRLLKLAVLRAAPPRSFERTAFGPVFLKKHFGRVTKTRLPGILATLSLLTVRSIRDSYRRFLPKGIREVVVSGGGALNPVLMLRLAKELDLKVIPSENHGMPVMAKEAACFAWLALRTFEGRTNNCPRATGARGRRVLGKIIPQ